MAYQNPTCSGGTPCNTVTTDTNYYCDCGGAFKSEVTLSSIVSAGNICTSQQKFWKCDSTRGVTNTENYYNSNDGIVQDITTNRVTSDLPNHCCGDPPAKVDIAQPNGIPSSPSLLLPTSVNNVELSWTRPIPVDPHIDAYYAEVKNSDSGVVWDNNRDYISINKTNIASSNYNLSELL